MGLVTQAQCDIFGTFQDVEQVGIIMRIIPPRADAGTPEPLIEKSLYMSKRARDRLMRLIEKGCTPPTKRSKASE